MGDTTTALRESGRRRQARETRQGEARCRSRRPTTSTRPTRSCGRCSPPISERPAARGCAQGPDDLQQVADAFEKAGRHDAALDVLGEISAADPANLEIKPTWRWPTSRAAISTRRGLPVAGNRRHQSGAVADAGRDGAARQPVPRQGAAIAQALTLDRARRGRGRARLQARRIESGSRLPADRRGRRRRAAREGDFAAAPVALHEFTTRVRSHLVALMRLVEICVDGGSNRRWTRRRRSWPTRISIRAAPGSAHHQRRSRGARAVEQGQHRSLPPRAGRCSARAIPTRSSPIA